MDRDDPVAFVSDGISDMLGTSRRMTYMVTFFAMMAVLSYMVVVCAKPDFIYPGGKRMPGAKFKTLRAIGLSMLIALGLLGIFIITTRMQ